MMRFYDPTLIPWLVERAAKAKGWGEDKKALQGVITVTVLKLGKDDQLSTMSRIVRDYGTQIEKDALALAEKQLKACGDRVSCYLAEIEKSENQEQKTQFAGIKAGYMIGILGNEQTRDELIKRLDDARLPAPDPVDARDRLRDLRRGGVHRALELGEALRIGAREARHRPGEAPLPERQ